MFGMIINCIINVWNINYMTGCVDQEKVCAKKFSRFPNISTHLYHVSGVIYHLSDRYNAIFFFYP